MRGKKKGDEVKDANDGRKSNTKAMKKRRGRKRKKKKDEEEVETKNNEEKDANVKFLYRLLCCSVSLMNFDKVKSLTTGACLLGCHHCHTL